MFTAGDEASIIADGVFGMPSEQIQQSEVASINEFITRIKKDCQDWIEPEGPEWPPHVWFRGEPGNASKPLLPKLYRKEPFDPSRENKLLQAFRMKAPVIGDLRTPMRDHIDQWLFLAQHVGVPTRLLDWTESALVALYFALRAAQEEDEKAKKCGQQATQPQVSATVWMLNPMALNQMSVEDKENRRKMGEQFPLTWVDPRTDPLEYLRVILHDVHIDTNISKRSLYQKEFISGIIMRLTANSLGTENILSAWEERESALRLPVAVLPTNIHPRMSVQRSCFTVWGAQKESLEEQLKKQCEADRQRMLRKFVTDARVKRQMLDALRVLGISYSTIFPDLDGLAKELSELF